MSRFELKESDYAFNASLDPFLVLKKMGFTEHSIFSDGDIVRVHCPIHKDLVRKSLIIDTGERTFKCQYTNCEAHEGGLLIELVALYYDCDISDVNKALFGEEDKSAELLFRGEMFINQGRHQDALPYLEQACDFNPRDEVTRCKLAALYLELDRKDDAFREYLQAAESYAVRGELEKTLSIYNILIMLQPGAVKARKELSFLFARMGRPDAAAEQLKWVVDYYLKHQQYKGAQDAIESILELDPENGMGYHLLGVIGTMNGRKLQAIQGYEKAVQLFIKSEDFNYAKLALDEVASLTPGNPSIEAMRREIRDAEAEYKKNNSSGNRKNDSQADETGIHFADWMAEVDAKLAAGEPLPMPSGIHALPDTEVGAAGNDGGEISPEDRRVALCLNDIQEMDDAHIEAMRQQLSAMFTDVRKSFEEGNLSAWEMRAIKDFYRCFCIALNMHREKQQQAG